MSLLGKSRVVKKAGKDIWEMFTPEEMKVIATIILKYQKLAKVETDPVSQLQRPYTILDRFIHALAQISEAHAKIAVNSEDLPFRACVYDPVSMRPIPRGDLLEKDTAKTKEIYQAIMSKDWGKVEGYAKEVGDKVAKAYKFEEGELAPFTVEAPPSGISRAISNALEPKEETPKLAEAPLPPAEEKAEEPKEKPRRGRRSKVAETAGA